MLKVLVLQKNMDEQMLKVMVLFVLGVVVVVDDNVDDNGDIMTTSQL